jgi:predicted 2-oxoglutarate/Fe(II)-dependent dioxygenase YbiX
MYNSDTWWLGVKTYDIVLFPSNLTHSVDSVTSDETRISLAFNSFIKGVLGDKAELSELINE